jgi:phosphonate degradation associated HDIG domain protein
MLPSNPHDVIDFVFALYHRYGEQTYFGEKISQLEHALQSAALAQQTGAQPAVIVAALLHDIGHLDHGNDDFKNQMDGYGTVSHERIGARLVRDLGFSEDVAELIVGHVEAKRYLVAKHPHYRAQLSEASLETLRHQGGPMTAAEITQFEHNPHCKDMLRLRAWDDQAKVENLSVPGLQTYRQALLSTLD